MRSLLLSVLAPLTLSSTGVASPLTGSFVPQDGEKPGVVPAPLTAEDVEGQIDPLDGEILGKPIHGERIPKEHISPGRIESMTLVLQRERYA